MPRKPAKANPCSEAAERCELCPCDSGKVKTSCNQQPTEAATNAADGAGEADVANEDEQSTGSEAWMA